MVECPQHVAGRLSARFVGDVHCDHDIGTQLARSVHRHRAGDAAINIVKLANRHRLKYARHAAGRAHGLPGVADVEHRALAIFQSRGHRDKWLAQFVDRLVAHLRIHIVFELLPQHQSAG
ncbi:hypothetical protein SDC9_104099 [bioreactor metagenome]|uniref:Uncharacterized protein n=1 Tax=bioreactor metagenome TaxID=1076179 RepID=A0A645AVV4_9ZZZZ